MSQVYNVFLVRASVDNLSVELRRVLLSDCTIHELISSRILHLVYAFEPIVHSSLNVRVEECAFEMIEFGEQTQYALVFFQVLDNHAIDSGRIRWQARNRMVEYLLGIVLGKVQIAELGLNLLSFCFKTTQLMQTLFQANVQLVRWASSPFDKIKKY